MYVYLLHFNRPISSRHTTQHYIGFAECLATRIQRHESGNGARLVQVAKERGIHFKLVRVWCGDRELERRLKNWKCAPRLCPVCAQRPSTVRSVHECSAGEIEDYLIAF